MSPHEWVQEVDVLGRKRWVCSHCGSKLWSNTLPDPYVKVFLSGTNARTGDCDQAVAHEVMES